jgi:hypothetical protein
MGEAENLFRTTTGFLTPDLIDKFSFALDEPRDKVQVGLREYVLPTLLTEIINEGSTDAGARKIVDLVSGEDYAPTLPADLNDEAYLSKGTQAVQDLLGEDPKTVANALTPAVELGTENVGRMIEMITPVVMGVIGDKVKSEKLSASSLQRFFLNEQRSRRPLAKRRFSFALTSALGLLVLLSAFWLTLSIPLPVSDLRSELVALDRATSNRGVAAELPPVLSLQKARPSDAGRILPRVVFRSLAFSPGTTDFQVGGDRELDVVAGILKRNPKLTATIEAYFEDSGDPDENLLQSENRAMLVREELIGRGIEPSRLRASGRGSRANDTPQLSLKLDYLK